MGNIDNSGKVRIFEPPQKAEPLQMNNISGDGQGVTFGSNAVKKFRSHAERIRSNAKAHGFDIPRGGIKKPEVQAKIQEYIEFIVKNGKTRIGAYKPTGGGEVNALWTKYGNSIVVRRSNQEFITFFDASKGGAAVNFPGGL